MGINKSSTTSADLELNIKLNENKNKPFSIYWTPICGLCCIGHVGISNSFGTIHDFKNTYYMGVNFKIIFINQPNK